MWVGVVDPVAGGVSAADVARDGYGGTVVVDYVAPVSLRLLDLVLQRLSPVGISWFCRLESFRWSRERCLLCITKSADTVL